MITKKIMYLTSNGIACDSLPEAQEKQFQYLLQKMFSDHVSNATKIDIGVLWSSFEAVSALRDDVLKGWGQSE